MNTLQRIVALHNEARDFGFDWPNSLMIIDQIMSECREVKEDIENNSSQAKLQEEIGDLFQAVISLCVFSGFDTESILDKTSYKFANRIKLLKDITKNKGMENLKGQSVEYMLKLWKEVKKQEAATNHDKDLR
jgi:uncharacterized protein YabN with tetrapyrrole methylase and pyrophosphatase domain